MSTQSYSILKVATRSASIILKVKAIETTSQATCQSRLQDSEYRNGLLMIKVSLQRQCLFLVSMASCGIARILAL